MFVNKYILSRSQKVGDLIKICVTLNLSDQPQTAAVERKFNSCDKQSILEATMFMS